MRVGRGELTQSQITYSLCFDTQIPFCCLLIIKLRKDFNKY